MSGVPQPNHESRAAVRPMYARHSLLGPSPRQSIPENGMPLVSTIGSSEA
jgi:hypothetical protein